MTSVQTWSVAALCLATAWLNIGCAQHRAEILRPLTLTQPASKSLEWLPVERAEGSLRPSETVASGVAVSSPALTSNLAPAASSAPAPTPAFAPTASTPTSAIQPVNAIEFESDRAAHADRKWVATSTLNILKADHTEPLGVVPPLLLQDVLNSIGSSYPLLQAAYFERNIAQGELLQANGEFDLKLKADTLNMPLGFYDNYRHSIGAEQPLFGGGSFFGGYRRGTGSFPAYYGERETKLGGEFKAGLSIPLLQNRVIDDRRAGIWRSAWEVQSVEPEIQAQLIVFVQNGSVTYWNWIAAGQNVRIAEELLKNATERNDGLRKRVTAGDAPEVELIDNERLIVSRRIKVIDARRKLLQSAFKLSLFVRDAGGKPIVVDDSRLPSDFPEEEDPNHRVLAADLQTALANRPELRSLAILHEQLQIDLSHSENLSLPQLDAVVMGSQDVGQPSNPKKDDKSAFELEGGVVASVPLQRRKARGKVQAVEGKLAQLQAKTQFTQDKIVAEVQSTNAALHAAYQQLGEARRSLELAKKMEAAERRRFDLGDSNLLLVNLREQATADAASTLVEAHLNYFDAAADYRAAMGGDAMP